MIALRACWLWACHSCPDEEVGIVERQSPGPSDEERHDFEALDVDQALVGELELGDDFEP